MADAVPLVSGAMLPDGSNPEGVDPVPPLAWKSKSDFTDVVFYGMHVSPPCAKIMVYLIKFDIPFKVVEGMGKPGSDYKKMPVIDVGGRQVNDTAIILKYMVPVLTGQPFESDWEDIASYQLAPSIEKQLSTAEVIKWTCSPYGFGMPNWLLKCCLGKVLHTQVILPNIEKALTNVPKAKIIDLNELAAKLKTAIGTKEFYHGNKPGQVDISVYGTILPFYYKQCESIVAMIGNSGLQPWWNRMEQAIPPSKVYPPL